MEETSHTIIPDRSNEWTKSEGETKILIQRHTEGEEEQMRRERREEARCGNKGGITEEKTLIDRGRQICKEEGEKTERRTQRRHLQDTRVHGKSKHKTQHKDMNLETGHI